MLTQSNGPIRAAAGPGLAPEKAKDGGRGGRDPKNRSIVQVDCKNSPFFGRIPSATWQHSQPRDVPPAIMPSAAILHIDISVAVGATKTARTSQPGSTHDRGPRVEDIATRASKAALGVIDKRINQAE